MIGLSEEQKEKLMPIVKHFGWMIATAAVGMAITSGNEYLVPALKNAFPGSTVIVPGITYGFGLMASLYAKSPMTRKG